MKKHKKIIFLSFFILLGYVIINNLKPIIIFENTTDKTVYLYHMQWHSSQSEPEPDEVSQLKKTLVIAPHQTIKLRPNFSMLFSNHMQWDIYWKIGSRLESEAYTGGKIFSLSNKQGSCKFTIEIFDNNDSFNITTSNKWYCYKNLVPK